MNYRVPINLKVNFLEEEDLEVEEEEEKIQEEVVEEILKEYQMKNSLNKNVVFAKDQVMVITIIGLLESLNGLIMKSLVICKNIVGSRIINKLISLKSKKVEETCSILIKQCASK